MELSKRRRRWISIFVGVVGLVTVVGLSDLIFVIPQQQAVDQTSPRTELQTIPTTVATPTPVAAPRASSTAPVSATGTPLGEPNSFGL